MHFAYAPRGIASALMVGPFLFGAVCDGNPQARDPGGPPVSGSGTADAVGRSLQQSMIWLAAPVPGTQVYAAFRKRFECATLPEGAVLHIFADSRYILWINGEYVLRGPGRFDPGRPEYDTVDVRSRLRRGPNVLAILVHHYAGGRSGRIMEHVPGVTVRLDLAAKSGQIRTVTSDAGWRASVKTRFLPSPSSWGCIPDVIDARRDSGDWTTAAFDDTSWAHAVPIDGGRWGRLCPRSIPLLHETEITPVAVLERRTWSAAAQPHWIWHREREFPQQKGPRWSAPGGVRFFRRTFALPPDATDVLVRATADNEFDAYFNGEKIGDNHGNMESWRRLRKMDASRWAHSGRNVVAFRAVNREYAGASDPAGLVVLVTWSMGKGKQKGVLVSDGSWKSSAALVPGWTGIDFDDSSWEAALDLGRYGCAPWRDGVRPAPTAYRAVEEDGPKPLSEALPVDLEGPCELVVDVGRMVLGYSVLDFDADAGDRLELQYAQRYVRGEPAYTRNLTNRYTARSGRQTYASGDSFGFKYLVIRVVSGKLRLRTVKVVQRVYPFDLIGSFTSNDPVLNAIWRACVHTIALCSEDAYIDCILRERAEWMADGYVVAWRVSSTAFAGPGLHRSDAGLLRNLIRHIARSLQPDGRLKAHHPSDRWDIHGYIEDYSCLWVQAVREYYDHTGDIELVRECLPAMTAQLRWFMDRRTENGLIRAREFVYFGNPLLYKTCEGATLNAFLYHALRDAAYLAGVLDRKEEQARYNEDARALMLDFDRLLWDEDAGAYRGALLDGGKSPPTVHAAVCALFHGIVPGGRRGPLTRWVLKNYRREGLFPYTHYFLLDVFYRADTPESDNEALNLIRTRWGPMLERETGTVSEGFGGGEWCHEAGAAPAYFLSIRVLGVRVDLPVWKRRLIIEPHLGDLQEAAGVVVTEFGPVPVSWKRPGPTGALEFTLEVPGGVQGTVFVPRGATEPTLTVDGKVWIAAGRPKTRSASLSGRYAVLRLGPGKHSGILHP
ncbi:MAG: hypothetical protein GXP31_19375 [Kiritimatiellaeota bacterium]|nr:hypothetical protein [Kiritimatiellota bacterium]